MILLAKHDQTHIGDSRELLTARLRKIPLWLENCWREFRVGIPLSWWSECFFSFVQVNSFVGAFYDAVILYALALNETLEAGYNSSNGREITHRMWNRTFQGEIGFMYEAIM